MDESTKILLVKDATEEKDESIITAYLEWAKQVILHQLYPFEGQDMEEEIQKEMPSRFWNNQVQIAAYIINKRGAEGQLSMTENGVSRNYSAAGIPNEYLRDITPLAEVL